MVRNNVHYYKGTSWYKNVAMSLVDFWAFLVLWNNRRKKKRAIQNFCTCTAIVEKVPTSPGRTFSPPGALLVSTRSHPHVFLFTVGWLHKKLAPSFFPQDSQVISTQECYGQMNFCKRVSAQLEIGTAEQVSFEANSTRPEVAIPERLEVSR